MRQAWAAPAGRGVAQRCAMLMVLMIGLHSLLEYPLWYSYFLLPAAWAWGFALHSDAAAAQAVPAAAAPAAAGLAAVAPSKALFAAALVVVMGAALSVVDYLRVAAIFEAVPGAAPLEERIAAGQRSIFFAHHADYAAVTSGLPVADPAHAFDRATHYLLDTRLMIAWAQSLAERGELDAARHIAARLREFHHADAAEFFAPCKEGPALLPAAPSATSVPAAGRPFQCEPPARALAWRSFTQP